MIPPDFASECLYTEETWYIRDILELEPEGKRVVVQIDTARMTHLVGSQVVRPGHPRHVPAALMVQLTGTLGNLHAVYGMGCRMSEGWVGYGTGIRNARFPSIGLIGPDFIATMDVTRVRKLGERRFVEYRFNYDQEGRTIYMADHTALWIPGHLVPGQGSPESGG